jgi:multiple sugar transport system permease protein
MTTRSYSSSAPVKYRSSQYYRSMALLKNGLTAFFMLLVILFTLFPFYWMLKSSFQTPAEIIALPPIWIPLQPTLDGYIRAVTLYPIPRYLLNSVMVSSITALLATGIASTAAYVIARYKFPGATFFLGVLIFTQLIPGITRFFPIYFLIKDIGLINTYPGLITAYMGFSVPFAALMLQGYFRSSCPPELEEAALIDGCTYFSAFTKVMLPVSIPGIMAVAIFTFLGAWNDFLWASQLLNQGQLKTLQVGLRDFLGEAGSLQRINSFMAACVIATIPALLLYTVLQRNMVAGLSAGSMKG